MKNRRIRPRRPRSKTADRVSIPASWNMIGPRVSEPVKATIKTLKINVVSAAKTSSDRRLYKCGTAAQTGKKCAMSGLKHTCVWVGTNKYKECDCQDTEAWPEPEDTDNGSNRLMSISIPIVTMTSAFFVLCNV